MAISAKDEGDGSDWMSWDGFLEKAKMPEYRSILSTFMRDPKAAIPITSPGLHHRIQRIYWSIEGDDGGGKERSAPSYEGWGVSGVSTTPFRMNRKWF